MFAVLTLDRDGRYNGDGWADTDSAYKALSELSRKWLKRLNRMLEKLGLDPVGSRWVATVEAHRSGWPHVNFILVSRGLAGLVRDQAKAAGPAATDRERTLVRGELLNHTVGSGWGHQSTMEQARSKEALAGYMVKVAGDQHKDGTDDSRSRLTGEVVKLSQLPMNAPKNTRRLRSGKGFLPPPHRNEEMTGVMTDDSGRALGIPKLGDLYRMEPDERREKSERIREVEAVLGRPLCRLRPKESGENAESAASGEGWARSDEVGGDVESPPVVDPWWLRAVREGEGDASAGRSGAPGPAGDEGDEGDGATSQGTGDAVGLARGSSPLSAFLVS